MGYRTLVTGGSGVLGTALREVLADAVYPQSSEFDVARPESMDRWAELHPSDTLATVVHAAAFTSPPRIDANPEKALDVNIGGTVNVVHFCARRNLRLVYISTDYVFDGDKGEYLETDPVYPVNKYAWSKLGGECAVRLYDNSLILRMSFGPVPFPYEKAFADQYTSREPVTGIVAKIARIVDSDSTGVLHIGAKRRTVLEYAKSIDPAREIKPLLLSEVSFSAPRDTSLNTDRYGRLFGDEE